MAQVTITLNSDLLLSDDGGNYENETITEETASDKIDTRRKYYQRNGDGVSINRERTGGHMNVEIKGDHTVY
jgi:hypothetical protein